MSVKGIFTVFAFSIFTGTTAVQELSHLLVGRTNTVVPNTIKMIKSLKLQFWRENVNNYIFFVLQGRLSPVFKAFPPKEMLMQAQKPSLWLKYLCMSSK